MNNEILKVFSIHEAKANALDLLRDTPLYHFDVDMHVEGRGGKTVYYVRLWQEGDDKGEAEAPTLSDALVVAVELAKRLVLPTEEPQPEPENPELNIVNGHLNPMERGRMDKVLSRTYRFDVGLMPLGDYLHRFTFHRKSQQTQFYARKRQNLKYKMLAQPKTEYTLWHMKDGKELGVDVPKIVYDALPDIPEITFEQYQKGE